MSGELASDAWTSLAPRHCRRRALLIATWLIISVAGTLLGNLAPASAVGIAETRVGASSISVEPFVGPPEHIRAGQRLGNDVAGPGIVVATGVAANNGIRALPSGPKIAAEWGADTYRHGGLMSTIEHVNYRHAYGSGFSGVSRYAEGTSVRDIKGYVDYVLRNGSATDRGMIGDVGRTIGTDPAGNPVTGLEIIVRDGLIKTAFPAAAP